MAKARKNAGLIEYVLPKDVPQRDVEFMEFYSDFNTSMMPVAFLLSYHRNRSFKWAIIHTLLGAPYVAYVAGEVVGAIGSGSKAQ